MVSDTVVAAGIENTKVELDGSEIWIIPPLVWKYSFKGNERDTVC